MQQPDQKELFEVLEKQKQNQLQVDRILKIVLPIVAFLLSVICANLNWQSTLSTFVILTITFIAVGIKRLPLWHWLIVITLYCLADNYLSYGQLDLTHLRLQLGTMLVFVGMVGIGRPYIDRWFMKSHNKM
ncbi:hypothetical protein DKE41_017840 [Acinetobacter pittii]|uniref:hypothetical protein n=1 Tax=Acinetobacter pittii TaxID=48296 RepID=UPI000E2B8A73|nr:hypothetical protein DKE41_017840 [Acinetobacter pittii]